MVAAFIGPYPISLADAWRACGTEVALLHDGGLAAHGPPETVLTPARLQAVYGVPVFVERLASGDTVCAPDLGARYV